MSDHPYLCCGCGAPFDKQRFKTCGCATGVGAREVNGMIQYRSARHRLGCEQCGADHVVTNLDNEDLCWSCANKWVRGEGLALLEMARTEEEI